MEMQRREEKVIDLTGKVLKDLGAEMTDYAQPLYVLKGYADSFGLRYKELSKACDAVISIDFSCNQEEVLKRVDKLCDLLKTSLPTMWK